MNKTLENQRDQIVLGLLENISATGWTMGAAHNVCDGLKIDRATLLAIFPGGLCDIVAHFSDLIDRDMLKALAKTHPEKMRVRDRIETAVTARFAALEPHKDAIRLALAYWSVPPRHIKSGRVVWRTADRIWLWAGDTANDYNKYTKRALLSGILTATTLVWLKDGQDGSYDTTHQFLANRIENVLEFGQILGKFKFRNA